METVTSADGTHVAVERHGDDERSPVVLLHGGSPPDYWRPVVPRLADDHEVLVPHRRGVGASGDRPEYALARGVADVRAVVDDCGAPPVLVGPSFGGLLSVEAAREATLAGLVAYEPAVLVGAHRDRAALAATLQRLIDAGERKAAMRRYLGAALHDGDAADVDGWPDDWPPWQTCPRTSSGSPPPSRRTGSRTTSRSSPRRCS